MLGLTLDFNVPAPRPPPGVLGPGRQADDFDAFAPVLSEILQLKTDIAKVRGQGMLSCEPLCGTRRGFMFLVVQTQVVHGRRVEPRSYIKLTTNSSALFGCACVRSRRQSTRPDLPVYDANIDPFEPGMSAERLGELESLSCRCHVAWHCLCGSRQASVAAPSLNARVVVCTVGQR